MSKVDLASLGLQLDLTFFLGYGSAFLYAFPASRFFLNSLRLDSLPVLIQRHSANNDHISMTTKIQINPFIFMFLTYQQSN